ncbi:372_t:CDS:2 [Paraglomus brasilianum]|uniref:372_t:CDS:1 n=1 Tax=Paraglomus brasilianum TaxID=144538 RepID=A0A9N9G087_9GLOM|nr:372_t:CDS:2 [Paraglomus brasilianum]
MNFEKHILKYLDVTDYTEWSLLGLLEYLAGKVSYSSASLEDIIDNFTVVLQARSTNKAYLRSAQKKAERLYIGLDSTRTRPEILQFLKVLDLEHAENLYSMDVELGVVSNKSALSIKKKSKSPLESDQATPIRDAPSLVTSSASNSVAALIDSRSPEKRKREEDNEIAMDIFSNEVECSDTMRDICSEHTKYYPDDDVIDLRPKSTFSKRLSSRIIEKYVVEIEEKTESLIPENVHNFLTEFFSQDLTGAEWQQRIDDLRSPDDSDTLMVATMRILRRTLPQFVKAFSLGAFNPLLSVHYEFGEIPSKNHVNRECADGVGFMTSADKFQLVYVEGSRPTAKDTKEIADARKVARNLQNMFSEIVKTTINNRRRLPADMSVFGGQSFELRIYLHFLDYCGKPRLNEVDNANVPRDFSEMLDFVSYYESDDQKRHEFFQEDQNGEKTIETIVRKKHPPSGR